MLRPACARVAMPSLYSAPSLMDLAKMAGFEVTPATASSAISRARWPSRSQPRRMSSSQMLWPNSWTLRSGLLGLVTAAFIWTPRLCSLPDTLYRTSLRSDFVAIKAVASILQFLVDACSLVFAAYPAPNTTNAPVTCITPSSPHACGYDERDFRELREVTERWQMIREEALKLFDEGHIRAACIRPPQCWKK